MGVLLLQLLLLLVLVLGKVDKWELDSAGNCTRMSFSAATNEFSATLEGMPMGSSLATLRVSDPQRKKGMRHGERRGGGRGDTDWDSAWHFIDPSFNPSGGWMRNDF